MEMFSNLSGITYQICVKVMETVVSFSAKNTEYDQLKFVVTQEKVFSFSKIAVLIFPRGLGKFLLPLLPLVFYLPSVVLSFL